MICIAFPTIMSGLVLRWYADEDGYRAGVEIASASREYFATFEACSDEVRKLADSAHSYLTVEYFADLRPQLDVSRWVTHQTPRLFSRELRTVEAAPTGETR